MNMHEQLFLLGIARFFKSNEEAYTSLSRIEESYAIVCEEFGVKPNSHTQLWKYLRRFSALGIITTEVSANGSRGRSTLISLPRIPAGELEKELTTLLQKERS